MSTTQDDVDGLRELLAKATPGPWRDSPSSTSLHHTNSIEADHSDLGPLASTGWVIADLDEPWQRGVNGPPRRDRFEAGANARLIVAAVNALPALLDERDRLRSIRDGGISEERLADVLASFHGGPAPWPKALTSPQFARAILAALRAERDEPVITGTFDTFEEFDAHLAALGANAAESVPEEAWTDVPGHGSTQFLAGTAALPGDRDVQIERPSPTMSDLRELAEEAAEYGYSTVSIPPGSLLALLDAGLRVEAESEPQKGDDWDPSKMPTVSELDNILRTRLPYKVVYAIRPTGDPFTGWARMMLGVEAESVGGLDARVAELEADLDRCRQTLGWHHGAGRRGHGVGTLAQDRDRGERGHPNRCHVATQTNRRPPRSRSGSRE